MKDKIIDRILYLLPLILHGIIAGVMMFLMIKEV